MIKYRINLLQQEKKIIALSGKLVYFALYYLRYIVIMTQIVVIGVFFYRFTVDQRVIDLRESINQKQEIIKVAQPLIKEAKTMHAKTTVIKSLLDKQKGFTDKFDSILSVIPQTITLHTLTIAETTIDLKGDATDVTIIRALYERLKKNRQFKNIVINQITKKDGLYGFSINIDI